MGWLALGLGVWAAIMTAYAINMYFDLGAEKIVNEMLSEDYELHKNTVRDIDEELKIAQMDLEEAREALGVWKERYIDVVQTHSLLVDEREQLIGDRHDLVILGDQDVFTAYYHGELIVGQKRLNFSGYDDDTYRFEVVFGTEDKGSVYYYDEG